MHPPDDPGFEQLRHRAEAWGAPLLSVPDRGPLDWRVVTQMLAICRRERVAIWHGHDYKSNAAGPAAAAVLADAAGHHRPRLGGRTGRTPLYYRIDRLCLPHYERVICVSEDLLRAVPGLRGVPRTAAC